MGSTGMGLDKALGDMLQGPQRGHRRRCPHYHRRAHRRSARRGDRGLPRPRV